MNIEQVEQQIIQERSPLAGIHKEDLLVRYKKKEDCEKKGDR